MGKELWLFTMRFPFGTGETFLGTELPILCARFERVIIVPLFAEGVAREIPSNASVSVVVADPYKPAGPFAFLRYWDSWGHMVRSMRATVPSREVYRRQWPTMRSKLRQALRRALIVRRKLFINYDPHDVVLYSFWTADWATVLGLLRLWDPRIRFVTRMLGFDLFTFRSPDGWPALRKFHLELADRIFIISQAGVDHMKEKYPRYAHKYELSLLATSDHGLAPWSPSPVLRLLSCSNLVALKRVHLIAEAVTSLDIPVQWTHFGDGPERAAIEAIIASRPAQCDVRLLGHCGHDELMKWYKANPTDLFLHMSSTEGGVPVALQEAASFGIPLLAADAGGVKEIVNLTTGTLLDADPTPERIAAYLRAHVAALHNSTAFRAGVRAWWSAHCRAEEVYGRFCDRLLAIHEANNADPR